MPYLEVERIRYQAVAPWPVGASGTGASLQRLAAGRYANEPLNWVVFPASAGVAGPDRDRDGLPDAWEEEYFGRIDEPRALPELDSDTDQLTNLQEWISGTSPVDPASYLRVTRIFQAGEGVHLEFVAIAGKTYTILFREGLVAGTWQPLASISARPDNEPVIVIDADAGVVPARIYRLVTPAQPAAP